MKTCIGYVLAFVAGLLVAGMLAAGLFVARVPDSPDVSSIDECDRAHDAGYDRGIKDGMEELALVCLALRLNGEQKTWGEMQAIVLERHGMAEAAKQKREINDGDIE